MITVRCVVVSLLCSSLTSAFVVAQEHGKPAEKPAVTAPVKAAADAKLPAPVFEIVRSHGKLEVMTKEAVDAKNKSAAEHYASQMKAYEKAKQAAEAEKKPFHGAMPKLATLEATGKTFDSREAAEAAMRTLEATDKTDKKAAGDEHHATPAKAEPAGKKK